MPERETLVFEAKSESAALQDERVQKLKRDGWKVTVVHELSTFWATFLKAEDNASEMEFLVQLEKKKTATLS